MNEPSPATQNVVIYTGQSWTLKFQMLTGTAPGTPVDFTGCSAEFSITDRLSPTASVLITTKGASPTATATLLADGWVEVKITEENTSLIVWKSGFYTIKVTWANGDTWRVFNGAVTVSFGA